MEQKQFNYSMKNIPLSNPQSYKKKLIEQFEKVMKRLRWKIKAFTEKDFGKRQLPTYGFNTSNHPSQVDTLSDMEKDFYNNVICKLEFRQNSSAFQKELQKDVNEIRKSDQIFVHADKSTNVYTVPKETYQKMLDDNITKTYRKARGDIKHEIDSEAKVIAYGLDLANRMEVYAKKEPFVTLKDHKPNFISKPTCRLIVPSKPEMGVVSQQILADINTRLREETKFNQWKNTNSVIEWFKNLPDKKQKTFIQFDIENFYPSITEDTLIKAFDWAKSLVDISDSDEKIVMHARRSLLFHNGEAWIKKDGSDFDVTMGSYDGAEVCELVGLYLLSVLTERFGEEAIGLYRDDGAIADKFTKRQADKARKDLIQIFKSCGFTITVEIYMPRMNYLDVTFDLPSEKYWPYRKPNNEPLYIHAKSNHPPAVLKHISKNIGDRLSHISCDEAEFNRAKPAYEDALKSSGFKGDLSYKPPAHSAPEQKKKRTRQRNITWFNPPYDLNCKTNVAQQFLNMISKYFPRDHPKDLGKIINRNTVKVSYCCMKNVGSIISSHNAKILCPQKEKLEFEKKPCNCRKVNCPLDGACLQKHVIYRADIKAPNNPEMSYVGLADTTFKERWRNHDTSFKYPDKRKVTALAGHWWKLRDAGVLAKDITVKWSIVQQALPYKCGTRRCDLCLSEKLHISTLDRRKKLNDKSEVVSDCRHRPKYLFSNFN